MTASDPRLIPLSALQHYAFCRRQCALIHNEQVWADNFLTAQGNLLHERVDSCEPETRKGIRFERGVQVSASGIGLTGKLDLVEHELATGNLFPVEYKRGKPKPTDWDKIQLCAQAFCLEEMIGRTVTEGALWYHQSRHRQYIKFDQTLRERTLDVVAQVKKLLHAGCTPAAVYTKQCDACSLFDFCQPKLLQKDQSSKYVGQLFRTDSADEEVTK